MPRARPAPPKPRRAALPVAEPAPLRPFLKWAGGKTRVVRHIRDALAPLGGKRLVEPFVGSGAVFLNLPHYRELLLADANADLVDLFRRVQRGPGPILRELERLFTPEHNTAEAYARLREEFNAARRGTRRAALFVYLNRHGYNGLCRYNASGGFNVPFGRYVKVRRPDAELVAFHERLRDTRATIEHADFRELLAVTRPGDVVYADPPYWPLSPTASFTAYSSGLFGEPQQAALAALARDCAARGVPVVISNHDVPRTRALYAGATIRDFHVGRHISRDAASRAPVAELLAIYPAAPLA